MSEQGPGYYDAAGEIYTQTEDPVNIRMQKEAEQKKAEEAAKADTTYSLKKEEIVQDDLSRSQGSATTEQPTGVTTEGTTTSAESVADKAARDMRDDIGGPAYDVPATTEQTQQTPPNVDGLRDDIGDGRDIDINKEDLTDDKPEDSNSQTQAEARTGQIDLTKIQTGTAESTADKATRDIRDDIGGPAYDVENTSHDNEKIIPYKPQVTDLTKPETRDESIIAQEKKPDEMIRFEPKPDNTVRFEEKPDDIIPKPEITPTPLPEKKEKILIADVSEVVKRMAHTIAENRLNEMMTVQREPAKGFLGKIGSFFKAVPKAMFASYVRMGEAGFLNKFYNEALETIGNNQDLMRDIQARIVGTSGEIQKGSADKRENWQILDAVVKQMEDEVLEEEEKGSDLLGRGAVFADLINRHIGGEFADRSAFEAAAREAIQNAGFTQEQFVNDPNRRGQAEGLMYASNLWDIANNYREKIVGEFGNEAEWGKLTPEQKDALRETVGKIGSLDIKLATKLSDLNDRRPERPGEKGGYLGFWDRVSSVARTRPILGALINPLTVGVAAGLGTRSLVRGAVIGGLTLGGIGVGMGFALPLITGAALGGVFAAINKRRNLAFDRGMEQRREALGQQGDGARAARLREFGFNSIGQETNTLIDAIRSGNEDATLEAKALLEAERVLRNEYGRGADLIYTSEQEGRALGTNLVSKGELRKLVKDNEATIDPVLLNNRVAAIVDQVRQQDKGFEGFRSKEAVKAGFRAAGVGVVAGLALHEAADYVSEVKNGAENGSLTLLEMAKGGRPTVEHIEANGADLPLTEGRTETITSTFETSDGTPIDVSYYYDGNGQVHMAGDLPANVSFDEASGQLIHEVPGVPGGEITKDTWAAFSDDMIKRHGDLFDQTQTHWSRFYENATGPHGNSYEPGYVANSESTELMMDFHRNSDGSVTVDLSRMAGHTAYTEGHKLPIDEDRLDNMVVSFGPRERVLSHDNILLANTVDGKVTVPKDVADALFTEENGRLLPADGVQVTADHILTEKDGETWLGHVAAEYNNGPGNLPGREPVTDSFEMPNGAYVPPESIGGPIPFPTERRDNIGNVPPVVEKMPEEQPVEGQPQRNETGPLAGAGQDQVEQPPAGELTSNEQQSGNELQGIPEEVTANGIKMTKVSQKEGSAAPAGTIFEGKITNGPISINKEVRFENGNTSPIQKISKLEDGRYQIETAGGVYEMEPQEDEQAQNAQEEITNAENINETQTPEQEGQEELQSLREKGDLMRGFSNTAREISEMETFSQRKEAVVDFLRRMRDEGVIPNINLRIANEVISAEELEEQHDSELITTLEVLSRQLSEEASRVYADAANGKRAARAVENPGEQLDQAA